MPKYVYEMMNQEVMTVAPGDPIERLPQQILALGITGVPVVADDRTPLGMISLRDLVAHPRAETAEQVMSAPPITVDQTMDLETASTLLCDLGIHRLICVDDEGKLVGVVSGLDLLRGTLGLPPRHPDAFPHFDRDTGVVWSADLPLTLEEVLSSAPEGPGVLVLIQGGRNLPETIVWAESAGDVASRLIDIVSGPQPLAMRRLLERGSLRFRAARIEEPERRRRALRSVANLGRFAHLGGPTP